MLRTTDTKSTNCERVLAVSLAGLLLLCFLHYTLEIFPFSGLWICTYSIVILFTAIWSTCLIIQRLLGSPIPAKINISSIISKCNKITTIFHIGKEKQLEDVQIREQEKSFFVCDKRIDLLSETICTRFVNDWYFAGVSADPAFTSESKEILGEWIRRLLQVSRCIDCNRLAGLTLSLTLRHCKEFRRAQRRARRGSWGQSIENLYRYSHPASISQEALESYTQRVTSTVLQEFVSWELWNSVPCKILVAIVSKRVLLALIDWVSNPNWINTNILSLLQHNTASLNTVTETVTDRVIDKESSSEDFEEDAIRAVQPQKIDKITVESALSVLLSHTTASILNRATLDDNKMQPSLTDLSEKKYISSETNPINTLDSDCSNFNQDVCDSGSTFCLHEPNVKIYDQLRTSSTKTWNSKDLQCISLGQDLLAMDTELQDADIPVMGRRLWENDTLDSIDSVPWCDEPINQNDMWFGEEDSLENESVTVDSGVNMNDQNKGVVSSTTNLQNILRPSATASSIITNTMRPIGNVTANTLQNMKELQQKSATTDEAAGVMEGILDFGIAGLKKGLRLTGLQDQCDNIKPKEPVINTILCQISEAQVRNSSELDRNVSKNINIEKPTITNNMPEDFESSVWTNPISNEYADSVQVENNIPTSYSSELNLLRENLTDMSSFLTGSRKNSIVQALSKSEPIIDSTNDSPEYEYEDTGDLASTIAKLRSLLQQKGSDSSLNTPAASPMPDEKQSATDSPVSQSSSNQQIPSIYLNNNVSTSGSQLNDPQLKSNPQNANNIQRFDKLLARTMTGVFNSIKTALPGNGDQEGVALPVMDQWNYTETDASDTDLNALLERLLVERRDYCTVDSAHEAMDSLELFADLPTPTNVWDSQPDDDDVDDVDLGVPLARLVIDILCESLQTTNNSILQEPVIKLTLVLLGQIVEDWLQNVIKDISTRLYNLIDAFCKLPTADMSSTSIQLSTAELVDVIQSKIPGLIQDTFGNEDVSASISFFLDSFQCSRVNREIICHFIDLYAAALIQASNQMSPTPSA